MPDAIDSSTQTVSTLSQQDVQTLQQARRSARDWVRQMRFNPEVNKSTIGVQTDRVTPELMLGTSASLLRISRGEEEPSAKDSLAYQRFYGPAEYFAEHIQRDQGKLARGILWKATNKGNLDFIGSNMLQPHISSVFYDSNLAQYLDGTTPFQAVDLTFKTTRVGQGGIASTDNAPDEMRTVQPSYYGFVDPVRCYSEDTQIWTKQGWISVQDMNGDMELGCLINGRMQYHKPMAIHVYDYNGLMLSYTDHDISYCVTPNHRMYTVHMQDTKAGTKYAKDYKISDATFVQAKDIVQGRWCMFTGTGNTTQGNQDQRTFVLPTVQPTLKHAQVHGMPPQGASLKNMPELDICDFAEFMGWYLSQGSCYYNTKKSNYRVDIAQDPKLNSEKYDRIRDLVMRLPFGTTPPPRDKANVHSIRIHRKQLYKYCQQFGDSFNKYIPEWIFTAPLQARLRFRQAMLLGDGRAQKHLCTVSKQLAIDFARLQMDLGQSVTITKQTEAHYPGHPGIYVVYWRSRTKKSIQPVRRHRNSSARFELVQYEGKVYCPTVPGGVVYVRRCADGKRRTGVFCGNSPQRSGVGLSGYMTKNVLKGSDGKLYQRFINARTGEQQLVDSVTAANSVISSHDVMEKNTRSVFAHGGKTGVRIVNRQDVDYYLPRPDDAYSTGSNMVTMLDGIKQMRLLMGCVHPMTPMITLDHQGMVHITSARNIADNKPVLYSCTPQGQDSFVICDKVLTRLTTGQKYFYKVVMSSGRVLITSPQHKWVTLGKQDKIKLLKATAIKPGMRVPRKLFVRTPVQNTDINGIPVTRDIAVLLGRIQRTMHKTDTGYRIQFLQQQRSDIKSALDKLCAVPSYFTVYKGTPCAHIKDPDLLSWIQSNIGTLRETHKVPACILSADTLLVAQYLDSYSKQVDNVGMDGNGDIWLMDLDNQLLRTAMAFLLSRIGTDTVFRDIKTRKGTLLALKLIPAQPTFGDCVVDTVVAAVKIPAPGYMIDFDADDDVYAVGHGVITHNSKYATQAVPLLQGQVPLVQSIDRYSGKTIESLVGRKLGARFAQKPGVVTAVRQDRVDVVYDDGKKGSIDLYKNFPANIKGYLSNRVLVKAGDRFDKDQIIAASNFTDDKGVQAMGRNLRVGYISYKGGTYQDACVLSESAAKKLSSRTMYKTNVDLNSTIRTGKNTYTMWKPQQYKNEALQKLDDDGVVKVGQVLHKGDPMVLAVQVAEPSPGTMGKRLLTDKCQEWEHAHPGVVTDVVKTRKGIKVYATVDAPVQVGDKLSGRYGNKSTCFQGLTQIMTDSGWKHFHDLTPQDKVAQLRPDGYAQFVYPTAYIEKDYDGQLCMYESRRLRWAVTPDHNMACIPRATWDKQKQDAQLQFIQAQLIQGKRMYHRCAAVFQNTGTVKTKTISADFGRNTHNTQSEYTFDIQDWASFLGLFLAQGYVAKRKQGKQQSHQVCITQKRDLTDPASCERCDKIQALLERMGLPYTRTGIKYVIVRKPLWNELVELGGSYDKFIPEQVFTDWPASAQQKLLQWHYMGDGDKTGTTIRCATVSKQLAYDLQRLYILNGYHCLVSQQNRSGVFCDGSQKPSFYRVTVLPDKFAQSQPTNQGSKQNYYRQRYRGKVYCVQVPTHTILVQLQGKPMWCGNCTLIIPDDQMPRDSKGRPLDMLMSPLGIVSRCYDKDTQFLTRKGWKKGADVIRQDQLYAYDPNTGMGLWSKQLQPMYSYKHTGIMYCAKSKAVDFCVTKGHRVWARTQYPGSSYTQRRIQDIFGKRYLIPCAAEHRDMPTTATDFQLPVIQIPHKDTHTTNQRIVYNAYDWAQFLGWYLTQGNTTWCQAAGKKQYRVHIAQNDSINPDKCQRIQKLLTRLGFTFNYGARNKQFHISGKRLAAYCKQFGNCAQKFIPDWLFEQPQAVIDRFLQALMLGDGSVAYTHTRKDGTRSCTQRICLCSQRLIDQLQYIYALKGIHTRKQKVKKDTRYADAKPMYSLGISTIDKTQHMLRGSMWYTTDYDGYVYCPTVTTGYVLTRRNGVLSCLGNTNPSQLIETQLGKIAQKLGHPIEVNQFQPQDKIQMVKRLSKLHNVPMSQDVYDPDSGRTLKGILTGRQYVYKLKHMAQSKMSARGTATYNAQGVPAAGGQQGSKRFGGLQSIGLIGHGAFDALVTDAKLIRGQSNAEFWRKIRVGQIPTIPGQPLVHKKFFAHLQGSGMRIRKTSQGISIFALTNSDVKQIAGNRQVKTRDTYQSKSFQPMDGGLFGTDIFGMDGTRWGYIQLDEPMLNPVMQQPVARLLQIPQKKLQAILRGQQQFQGKKGPQAIADALQKIDIENQSKKALAALKAASKSKKDAALKRYVAIQRMRRVGVHPSEFMLQRIPVLPPQFRPITSHNGLTMVADSNYLYAQLIDARDDMRAAQNLPDEYKDKARSMIYTKWKQLVGLYEPQDRKLKQKSVKGLLKWALGEPAKYGAFQRKVFGSIVDTVGRGVVVPNSRLKLNQVGLPQDMAWNVFSPFVTRALVQAGYSTVDALKATKSHSPVAKQYLLKAMQERPVIMNRAPSLHKLSLMGFWPALVTGHAIHVHPSIVVPFGMDFDGDTVCNQVLIWVQVEKIQKNIQKKSKQHLTQLEKAVYYASIDNQQEANMIAKEQKIQVMGFNCSLADLPVVDGSEVRKSSTVTEWDVVPGVYTHTIDPETGKAAAVEVTKVSKHSGLTMYDCKVSVSGAYSNVITASEDHSLITYNTTTMQLEKTKPQDAKGRCVPRVRYDDVNKPGMCYEYMDIAGQRPMSYKLGMFLGIMLGDGWVDSNNATKIACCDESLQKYITEELCTEGALLGMHKTARLHEYDPDPDRFSQNKRGVISVYLKSNVAEALGDVIGKGAENKRIPPFSLVGSRAHMIGILMGMLATDGSVSYSVGNTARKAATKTIAIHTISPMLRDGIQTLCRKLGIRTHATPYMGANSKSTCYAVTLSLEDFAREARKDKVHYRIPMTAKQESMERIIADVSAPAKGSNSYTIVPFPRGLFCEFSYAKVVEIARDPIVSGRAKGFIRRDVALRIADKLETADWKHYADPTNLKKEDRTGRTPEQAKAAVDAWIALVRDENTDWAVVEDVTPSTCTEGWDCTVPGPYTFALSDGTVVQDTVNIHAPVSRGAVRDIKDKMMPQRNLISMANRTILYKPQKQYIQGLYLATRTKDKPAKRFATLAEARQAYKQGTLDVDDPIQIG